MSDYIEYCNDPHCDCPKLRCTRKNIVRVPRGPDPMAILGFVVVTLVIFGGSWLAGHLLMQKFGAG